MTDREIDALVAEHCMGWKRIEGKDAIVAAGHAPAGSSPDYHHVRVWVNDLNSRQACDECGSMPEFSTEPVASKQLRDKMRDDGFDYEIEVSAALGISVKLKIPNDPDCFVCTGSTEERAFALTALRAKGVDLR